MKDVRAVHGLQNRVFIQEAEFYSIALSVLELIMIKRDIIFVPCVRLYPNDINACISAIVNKFYYLLLFAFLFVLACVFVFV